MPDRLTTKTARSLRSGRAWLLLAVLYGLASCAGMNAPSRASPAAATQTVASFESTLAEIAEASLVVVKTARQALRGSDARAFVDACMAAHLKGELDAARAALAKAWVSEQQCKVMDECLQLFGGYGYMAEYPIARMYTNARVTRIYGGSNEIMKELIARDLDPATPRKARR